MKPLTNPVAIAALNRVIETARSRPAPRHSFNSRTADKYVLRGFDELFSELEAIGRHQGRSTNSEVIAAILEALDGCRVSSGTLHILRKHLGPSLSESVLGEVPDFELANCVTPKKFVIRFPPSVRDKIREGVKDALSQQACKTSMNAWILDALVYWIKYQRQHYALLSTSITMDQLLLTNAG